jgi:phage anti-repressor protein
MPLDEKTQLMTENLKQHAGTDEVETEIVHDPFTLDMDIIMAIRLIQKNERGRQGRYRILFILNKMKMQRQELEMTRKIREGVATEQSKSELDH